MSPVPTIVRECFSLPIFRMQHLSEQAKILLDAWETSHPVKPFLGGDYALRDYAPPVVRLPKEFQDHKGVLTVLSAEIPSLRELEGYRIYGTFKIAPRGCPALSHVLCSLCHGRHVVRWSNDWRIVILVPLQ